MSVFTKAPPMRKSSLRKSVRWSHASLRSGYSDHDSAHANVPGRISHLYSYRVYLNRAIGEISGIIGRQAGHERVVLRVCERAERTRIAGSRQRAEVRDGDREWSSAAEHGNAERYARATFR